MPGCRTNYSRKPADKSPHVNTFVFPRDPIRRQIWLSIINTAWGGELELKSYSCICIKHFKDDFVQWETSAVRDDGSVLTLKRTKPKLTSAAYPSIFYSETTKLKGMNPPVYSKEDYQESSSGDNFNLPDKRRTKRKRKQTRKKSKTYDESSDEQSEDISIDMSSGESSDPQVRARPVKRKLEHVAFELEDDLDALEEAQDEGTSLGEFVAHVMRSLSTKMLRNKLKRAVLQLLIDTSEEDTLKTSEN